MSKLRVQSVSISIDGYGAGPDQSPQFAREDERLRGPAVEHQDTSVRP